MEYKYWLINHNADTTETGCPMNRTYVRTEWAGYPAQQHSELTILRDFCRERFGAETEYVQGVAACANWSVHAIDETAFKEAQPIRWGGMDTETRRLLLRIGTKGGKQPPVEVIVDQSTKNANWNAPRCPHCGGVLEPPKKAS